MPSSTIWLKRPYELETGRRTPPRPSVEAIERLSPDYLPAPRGNSNSSTNGVNQQSHGQNLQGLGLSYDSTMEEDTVDLDRIYAEQHNQSRYWDASSSQNTSHMNGVVEHPRPHTRDGATLKRKRNKTHTRSGSTIDDLASAAIATSPTFLSGSPPNIYGAVRPATSYIHSREFLDSERPAKRIRSEYLATTEWSPSKGSDGVRDLMLDAELLLGLRNGVDFMKTTASPPDRLAEFETTIHEPSTQRSQILKREPHLNHDSLRARDREETETIERHSPKAPSVEPLEDDLVDVQEAKVQSALHPEGHMDWQVGQTGSESRCQNALYGESTSNEVFMTVETDTTTMPVVDNTAKKPKRIKPEVQAVVCEKCQQWQRETRGASESGMWICCNPCQKWYHAACVGFKDDRIVQSVDKFVCADCEPANGSTTFVRKSSRARAAIDYAELNQGQIKPAADTRLHHWVQAIKNDELSLKPESFPRMRPELVTAEFFEDTDGLRHPVLIPAEWNPFTELAQLEQTIDQGEKFSDQVPDEAASEHESTFTQEEVINCGQDLLDMIMPRNLTVRTVSNIYGPERTVPVIHVLKQETDSKKAWTLQEWADYYENEEDKPVLNVISLEVSENALARLIRRPRFVRDMDLQDLVVPENVHLKSVQFYCLMSVAESYTDFHIDFGGSAVYYHILKGKKTFFFIPPEEKNMKKYEDWNNSPDQNQTFLGHLTGDCTRVDLAAGDTMLIPAGWIHAVWTPEDSLVIGGNFLTRTDFPMQFRVVEAEQATGTPKQFRYPFFAKIMWYALIKYLEEDPVPPSVLEDFINDEDSVYLRADPVWLDPNSDDAEPGDGQYNHRHYSKAEVTGFASLRDYLLRSAKIASDLPVTPPPSKTAVKAVKASIPKGHGEPMDLITLFAIWVSWKEGNAPLPEWVREDPARFTKLLPAVDEVKQPDPITAPDAVSGVFQLDGNPSPPRNTFHMNATDGLATDDSRTNNAIKLAGNGPKRVACSPCRKRRIRCVHKDDIDTQTPLENSRPPTRESFVSVDIITPNASRPHNTEDDVAHGPDSQPGSVTDASSTTPLNVAQAALATENFMSGTSMNKKGRNKACESCRKSKRRCIHDEEGNLDPTKAEEPAKPRGMSAKRPAQYIDELQQPVIRRQRSESNTGVPVPFSGFGTGNIGDELIDPALFAADANADAGFDEHSPADVSHFVQRAVDTMESTTQELGQNGLVVNGVLPTDPESAEPRAMSVKVEQPMVGLGGVVSSPLSSVSPEQAKKKTPRSPTPASDTSPQPSVETNGTQLGPPATTPSRHSGRQAKGIDRYVPDDTRQTPKSIKSNQRASSSVSSGQVISVEGKSRRSSSHTSATTHQVAAGQRSGKAGSPVSVSGARPGSSGSAADLELDPDEAFARQLQIAELGLRRRGTGRV